MTTPNLTDRIEAVLLTRPDRPWGIDEIRAALAKGDHAKLSRGYVARTAKAAAARLGWVKGGCSGRPGLRFARPDVAATMDWDPEIPDTMAYRIAQAFRSMPQREWTIAELAQITRGERQTESRTREYVAVLAKRVARKMGWTQTRLRGRFSNFTVYKPPKDIP